MVGLCITHLTPDRADSGPAVATQTVAATCNVTLVATVYTLPANRASTPARSSCRVQDSAQRMRSLQVLTAVHLALTLVRTLCDSPRYYLDAFLADIACL